jgi:hypothetical protein
VNARKKADVIKGWFAKRRRNPFKNIARSLALLQALFPYLALFLF